ncbi:hypothetical protein GCM10010412_082970 [Nonomuraea recticatena]|uniref:Uncharacterized protein n=1 Tax=Nonomuraea recticatena TaxID=46178 RepID=A0ABN3T4H2_9ACTN
MPYTFKCKQGRAGLVTQRGETGKKEGNVPNKKTNKSECQICGTQFNKPVGSKVPHNDPSTGKRCAGSSVSTGHAF